MSQNSKILTKNQLESLKQRLLEPANIILSYSGVLKQKAVLESLHDFEDELFKIINASNQLIEEIDKVVSDKILDLNEDQIPDFQKKTRHDLRNIVNIILGYSEMVLEDLETSHHNYHDIQSLLDETKKFNSNLEQLVQLHNVSDSREENKKESEILKKLASMIKPLAEDQANKIKGKILVVDDNQSSCQLIERILLKEGHKTELAYDGEEALQKLKKNPFDVVLLDVLMPKKNGYEVLMEMKQSLILKDIPIIMISGFKEEDTIVRCIEAGVEDYLTKPINNTLLKAKIYSSLERKKFRDKEKHDLEVAIEVQQSLIPKEASFPPNFFAANTAAKGVSGDFFDFVEVGSKKYAFILADVSGKGMHAGILMAKTSALFRNLCKHETNLKHLVCKINNELCETGSRGMFVTAVLGFYDKEYGHVEFINAGHEPVLICKDPTSFIDIESKSPPIGLFEMKPNELKIETYKPMGQRSFLFAFTDGVTEGKCKDGSELGREGLESIIRDHFDQSPRRIINHLNDQLIFENAKLHDDVTILGIQFN